MASSRLALEGQVIIMMGTRKRDFAPIPRVSLDDLVPKGHLYRRLEETLELSFVRELVRPLYASGGRPSVDPVVFFKLQLVMFFEGVRSERLIEVAEDRLSFRWYLGYDLFEALPDHSSSIKIKERYGLGVFRGFFEKVVEMCVEAGLVWGKELYFDATKVDADASLDSIAPRFAVEAHLDEICEDAGAITGAEPDASPPPADDEGLRAENNAAKGDWISRNGWQSREVKGVWYKRTADFLASKTDPDASPMKRRDSKCSHLGYYAHYVVDGGKARVVVNALVTPFEVTENAPMARPLVAQHLPLEAQTEAGDGGHGLWHRREHSVNRGDLPLDSTVVCCQSRAVGRASEWEGAC